MRSNSVTNDFFKWAHKYANYDARKRNSVPKHQVYNNAIKNIFSQKTFEEATQDTGGESSSQQSVLI